MKCKTEFESMSPREQAHYVLLLTIFEKLGVLHPPVSREYLELIRTADRRLT